MRVRKKAGVISDGRRSLTMNVMETCTMNETIEPWILSLLFLSHTLLFIGLMLNCLQLDRQIQSAIDAAARIIYPASRYNITSLLKELHWLRVPDRIEFKLCALVYTCLNAAYRVVQLKWSQKSKPRSLHITSSNTGRFSKFFHCHILQEFCNNKVIIKYSTSPQTCRYTTFWNIYVRKLVNQWNLSHHFVSQNWNITNICNIPDQCCW